MHVEAIVRVMGCACDNDWSMGISWNETNAEECVMVQTALFGQSMTQDMFNAADANGDGEIDGVEAATVIEGMIGPNAGRSMRQHAGRMRQHAGRMRQHAGRAIRQNTRKSMRKRHQFLKYKKYLR